jgi:hypothetical protein
VQAKEEETQSVLSVHHRDLDRMSESEILRLVVAGIDVACNPDSRIVLSTRSMRLAISSVPSATVTCPKLCRAFLT